MSAGKQLCTRLMRRFPGDMSFAFSYGSAVFQQEGYNKNTNKMIDFVFTVDKPAEWHKKNIQANRTHYSFLKYFGSNRIQSVQDEYGAGVYYNTLVKCDNQLIKYGVVSTKTLLDDLLHWKTLYLSGRLHKPVLILKQKPTKVLQIALQKNLQSAINVSLLLLPESFHEEELYTTIAGLSYMGDFRMTVGEDKNKVSNIVKPNLLNFQHLYGPVLKPLKFIEWNKENNTFQQDKNPQCILSLMYQLPKNVQDTIMKNISRKHEDMEEVFQKLAYSGLAKDAVIEGVQQIVKSSSWSQSLKGILTAGVVKSVRYGGEKLKKMLKGWKKK